jgi:hypothetical protein
MENQTLNHFTQIVSVANSFWLTALVNRLMMRLASFTLASLLLRTKKVEMVLGLAVEQRKERAVLAQKELISQQSIQMKKPRNTSMTSLLWAREVKRIK